MQVVVNREALAEAMYFAMGIVPKRTPMAALTAVKLTAKDKTLCICATDNTIAMRWILTQVDITREGEALIPAERIAGVVHSISEDTVSLHGDDSQSLMHVKGAASTFKLFGYSAKEFPVIDPWKEEPSDITVECGELAKMIGQVIPAVAAEASRFTLNAVLFEPTKNRLRLVGTDGNRLHYAQTDISSTNTAAWPVSLRSMVLLQKLLTQEKATCRIQMRGVHAIFAIYGEGHSTPEIVLRAAMVDGSFPSYQSVIPSSHDRKASIHRESFARAVKQAKMLTSEESKGVRLSFSSNTLQISSRTPERGEATVDVACELTGEPIEIGVNPEFLLDYLGSSRMERISVEMTTPNRPMKFNGDPATVAIIMPVGLK